MALNTSRTELTDREREEFEQEKTFAQLQSDHSLRLKELELEVAKIEAKWSVLLKIPVTLVKLPMLILFGFALIISTITKKDMPDRFWDYLSK